MKLLPICITFLASASAFTTPASGRSSVLLQADVTSEEAPAVEDTSIYASFGNELGAQAPLGLWDPLGFLDGASDEEFADLRLKELTHGRIAMLAFTGYLTTLYGYRFSGCEDVPSGINALYAPWPSDIGIVSFCTLGLLVVVMNDYSDSEDYSDWDPKSTMRFKSEFPGDFRNGIDRFGWNELNDETKFKKRAIELNNGRAAMMGWLALVTHEKLGNLEAIVPAYHP